MFFVALSALFFVCASAMRCIEVIPVGLMDCSETALLTTGTIYPSEKLYWVKVISFERNNIVHVNEYGAVFVVSQFTFDRLT